MNFENYLQQKNMVAATITRHHREVKRYEKWLNEKDKQVENASKKDLLEYLHYCKESRNLCNATQARVLQKLKNYYSYLAKQYGVNNCTHFLKIRGAERKHLPYIFSPHELDLLCDAYYYHTQEYTPSASELRHYPQHQKLWQGRYIALTLMAYQALHLQEIETLKASNFDLRKGTIIVHQWRRAAERKLPLHASQIGAIILFFSEGGTTLIPNKNHFERLNQSLKKLHAKYADFRQLRASRIAHWLKTEGLRKAQYLAGHKHIHSTEKYLAAQHETLQNDMLNFHPLN